MIRYLKIISLLGVTALLCSCIMGHSLHLVNMTSGAVTVEIDEYSTFDYDKESVGTIIIPPRQSISTGVSSFSIYSFCIFNSDHNLIMKKVSEYFQMKNEGFVIYIQDMRLSDKGE